VALIIYQKIVIEIKGKISAIKYGNSIERLWWVDMIILLLKVEDKIIEN
jgi:hypothetical protein